MENCHAAVHHVEGFGVAHEDGVVEGGVRLEEGSDMEGVIEGNCEGVGVAVFA
jgi:hypothetical protein